MEHCYTTGEVVHIPEIEASGLYNAASEPQPPGRQHGINSAILAPILTSQGKCYGVIQVLCKHTDFGYFSDEACPPESCSLPLTTAMAGMWLSGPRICRTPRGRAGGALQPPRTEGETRVLL